MIMLKGFPKFQKSKIEMQFKSTTGSGSGLVGLMGSRSEDSHAGQETTRDPAVDFFLY